jgi:curli production assembly/transport component CsgF
MNMHSQEQSLGRQGLSLRRGLALGLAMIVTSTGLPGVANAQELTHRFLNPSFGGNPFYSDHLRSIADIHRPDEPKAPTTPAPTEEELLARQLQARFLSQLSSQIRDRIENARPGDTGQFDFGDQRISFTRTATETRITFVNTTTNETRTIVVPVAGSGSGAFANSARSGAASQSLSPEQVLGSGGSALPPLSGSGALPPL